MPKSTIVPAAILLFALTSLSATPSDIPDAISLLKDVRAHQAEIDRIRENYTFHRTRRATSLDATGTVRSTTTMEREVFFVHGHQIARLVKMDGVPLSGSQARRENDRIRGLVQSALKNDPKVFQQSGRVLMISQILAVSTISNPRHETINGRGTFAFDFKGDPAAQVRDPRDTIQRAAKKMEGTVWFDEADRQVARMEIRLYDNFHIAGGLLANISKGTMLTFEQAQVEPGLWMHTASEQRLDGRVLLKGLHQEVHVEDTEFRKFNVETLQHIDASK